MSVLTKYSSCNGTSVTLALAGIKNVTLKDGTNLNLDDIDLSNLNWAGWQY
jgi:hypothetical protein